MIFVRLMPSMTARISKRSRFHFIIRRLLGICIRIQIILSIPRFFRPGLLQIGRRKDSCNRSFPMLSLGLNIMVARKATPFSGTSQLLPHLKHWSLTLLFLCLQNKDMPSLITAVSAICRKSSTQKTKIGSLSMLYWRKS